MEHSITSKLVKSVNVIKNKIKQMQDYEFNTNNHLNYIFKPVAGPLNAMLETNRQFPVVNDEKPRLDVPYHVDVGSNVFTTDKSLKTCDMNAKFETPEKYYSENDSDNDFEDPTSNVSLDKEDVLEIYDNINIPFGVRSEGDKFMIGSTEVRFSTARDKSNNKLCYLTIGSDKYLLSPGLKELLLRRKPNLSLVSTQDTSIYKNILNITNVHKRDYDSSNQLKGDKGLKYKQVIKPLFNEPCNQTQQETNQNKKRGAGLPKFKTYCENTEFLYWDDPNELVERLKLLIASKAAGNTNLDNEIISIIEELTENKIIMQ